MRFNKIRIIASAIISASLLTVPALAVASSFTFANDTNKDLMFRVNGVCPNTIGVLAQHRETVISEAKMKKACGSNKSHCALDVLNKADCSGKAVERVEFDTEQGIISTTAGPEPDGGYWFFRSNEFYLYVSNH